MKTNKHNKIPWFMSSLLITILGAMSLILLFLMQYYETRGLFFWTIVVSWIIILVGISVIFCVNDTYNHKIIMKQDERIKQLSDELDKLKK